MKIPTLVGTLSALALCGGLAVASDADPNIAEAKTIIQEFAATLQGELTAAMQVGGPVAAIEVCHARAPAIARDLSERTGWEVGRTSLKTRNLAVNGPDAWETLVLTQFDARQAAGEDVKAIAYAEIQDSKEGQRFRYMKAIPTADACLACHGSTMAPEVVEALDAAYPGDQARGYKAGEVRGAFTLAKPL